MIKILIFLIFTRCLYAVEIQEPWIKAVPKSSKMSAGYAHLSHNKKKTISLVAVKGKIAEFIELHTHYKKKGVMKMRQVNAIDILPYEKKMLKPMSYHIMLIQLTRPLIVGEKIPLELFFSDKSSKVVMFTVKKL